MGNVFEKAFKNINYFDKMSWGQRLLFKMSWEFRRKILKMRLKEELENIFKVYEELADLYIDCDRNDTTFWSEEKINSKMYYTGVIKLYKYLDPKVEIGLNPAESYDLHSRNSYFIKFTIDKSNLWVFFNLKELLMSRLSEREFSRR